MYNKEAVFQGPPIQNEPSSLVSINKFSMQEMHLQKCQSPKWYYLTVNTKSSIIKISKFSYMIN